MDLVPEHRVSGRKRGRDDGTAIDKADVSKATTERRFHIEWARNGVEVPNRGSWTCRQPAARRHVRQGLRRPGRTPPDVPVLNGQRRRGSRMCGLPKVCGATGRRDPEARDPAEHRHIGQFRARCERASAVRIGLGFSADPRASEDRMFRRGRFPPDCGPAVWRYRARYRLPRPSFERPCPAGSPRPR